MTQIKQEPSKNSYAQKRAEKRELGKKADEFWAEAHKEAKKKMLAKGITRPQKKVGFYEAFKDQLGKEGQAERGGRWLADGVFVGLVFLGLYILFQIAWTTLGMLMEFFR